MRAMKISSPPTLLHQQDQLKISLRYINKLLIFILKCVLLQVKALQQNGSLLN